MNDHMTGHIADQMTDQMTYQMTDQMTDQTAEQMAEQMADQGPIESLFGPDQDPITIPFVIIPGAYQDPFQTLFNKDLKRV